MEQNITKDRKGNLLFDGDIVRHDDGIRPPGNFRIEWNEEKIGYVLIGVDEWSGKDLDVWLRDWSKDHVELVRHVGVTP